MTLKKTPFLIPLIVSGAIVFQPQNATAAQPDFIFAYDKAEMETPEGAKAMQERLKAAAFYYCRHVAHSYGGRNTTTGCVRAVVRHVRAKLNDETISANR